MRITILVASGGHAMSWVALSAAATASGPSPPPGRSWALAQRDFYHTVHLEGKHTFCTCLGPVDPVVDNAITGPLSYDFNRGAKLVGRERITPEYVDRPDDSIAPSQRV